MQTERIVMCVSHHHIIVGDHSSSMNEETRNARLLIALNGSGTAQYDPRAAVNEFLKMRERRRGAPDPELTKNRPYLTKFLREEFSGI